MLLLIIFFAINFSQVVKHAQLVFFQTPLVILAMMTKKKYIQYALVVNVQIKLVVQV